MSEMLKLVDVKLGRIKVDDHSEKKKKTDYSQKRQNTDSSQLLFLEELGISESQFTVSPFFTRCM